MSRREMWYAEVDGLSCSVIFDDSSCRYHVVVRELAGTMVKMGSFNMTCFTKPIYDLMDRTDLELSRRMAEKLSLEIESERK